MAGPGASKKRKAEEGLKRKSKVVRKFKKQTDYDNQSSSEDEAATPTAQDFKAVNLQDSDDEGEDLGGELNEEEQIAGRRAIASLMAAIPPTIVVKNGEAEDEDDEPALDSELTDGSNSDSEDDGDDDASESEMETNPNLMRKRKRNDPEAFATSMSKILGSKLSTAKRSDPVLARSVDAIQASKEITDGALEKKAKGKMRDEKRAAMDKGRVKDVLGASTAFDAANGTEGGEAESVQAVMMAEKIHRKTAQRGVVRMFNAVREAQVKGEAALRESREKGLVGQGRREEKVTEMSKKGFLDLIAGGG